MESKNYGMVTEHIIGIAMKEFTRRMIEFIREHLADFETSAKQAQDGSMTDIVTDIDKRVQGVCVKWLQECFPHYGIVAEENGTNILCTDESLDGMYFTLDPIDGTKAFTRRQSHGIGTMISLVRGKTIIAAYVGDVMTREIYGYRPGSNNVHRVAGYRHAETLVIDSARPLATQYLLLRKRPDQYSPITRRLINLSVKHDLVSDFEITGGSIGISTARLWKGEVGATLFAACNDTPWDVNPVMGICQKLGFACFVPNQHGTRFVIYHHKPSRERVPRPDMLIIHRSRMNEFTKWQTTFLI